MQAPTNPHYEAANAALDNLDYTTPVTQQYGKLRNQINESGNEMFGANTSPEVAGKVRDGRMFRAMTDYGENMSGAKQRESMDRMSGKMSLGGATAPTLVNSGGNQRGEQWGSAGTYVMPALQMGMGA